MDIYQNFMTTTVNLYKVQFYTRYESYEANMAILNHQ